MNLTNEEILFLKHHNISEGEVYDGVGVSTQASKDTIRKLGLVFFVGNNCKKGHRIKARSGHCIQCDTTRIAFAKRSIQPGYVYIAGSLAGKLIKVGFTTDISLREKSINASKYAEYEDWVILAYTKVEKAGELEVRTQAILSDYCSPHQYFKERKWQDTREIFKCSYKKAIDALDEAMKKSVVLEVKKPDVKFVTKYCDFQNIRQAA